MWKYCKSYDMCFEYLSFYVHLQEQWSKIHSTSGRAPKSISIALVNGHLFLTVHLENWKCENIVKVMICVLNIYPCMLVTRMCTTESLFSILFLKYLKNISHISRSPYIPQKWLFSLKQVTIAVLDKTVWILYYPWKKKSVSYQKYINNLCT